MEFWRLEKIKKDVLDEYNIPNCILTISNRMTRIRGLAEYYRNSNDGNKITLASHIFSQSDSFVTSILLHELSHIITKQPHTARFYEVSDKLHKQYNVSDVPHRGQGNRVQADKQTGMNEFLDKVL